MLKRNIRIYGFTLAGSLCLLLILQTWVSSQTPAKQDEDAIPEWFAKKMTVETKGTGKWIADNAKHKSEQEPVDAYGMEYTYGAGNKSLKFRLFAITGQKESKTLWEYREFWHPGEKKVVVYQWGSDGTLGYGEVKPVDLSQGKFELEQVFFDSKGSSWKSRHESLQTEAGRQTKSFVHENGVWKESRTYLWKPVG